MPRSAPDDRFFLTADPMPPEEACERAGAAFHEGAGRSAVTHAAGPQDTALGGVVFLEDARAIAAASGTPSLILTVPAAEREVRSCFPEASLGLTDAPRAAFARLAGALHVSRMEAMPPAAGIDPQARIAPTAEIAPSAVICAGALVHDGAVVGPFALIGPGVVLGADVRIGSHASVTHAVLGAGCVLSAGVRIGEAGFGYTAGEEGPLAVPQLGRVILGERVEIGANSCVDRGTLGDTEIGSATKIDNLCQVAHNCRIGRNVLIASQTGISGSVTIGDGVMIGGQAGMADHIEIGEGAVVAAKAGLMRNVPAGERWGGIPARPAREWMKETAALSRLAKGRSK
ncbi:UDP-3-O-(3-hydroxymyristoyl)glucosamine N-acyltransferase [Parvularcula oceani]|uniref:UDP-3-O-(3-hydroxymyristoyl)glucosamine N-acyltransferase n=1 Tax=Parvularcula oceani TaxID=1247963 RepID=UPI0004E22E0C|nr:UDP-3-O-(3-hydroxymyristoyl)glucosamine N-acyltransferase [Parvularcula oceani]